MSRQVPCPVCGKPSAWSEHNRWRPFCSERCRLIDLGAWFDGSYRVTGDDQAAQQDDVHDPTGTHE